MLEHDCGIWISTNKASVSLGILLVKLTETILPLYSPLLMRLLHRICGSKKPVLS